MEPEADVDRARHVLSAVAYNYYASSVGDGATYRANLAAFRAILFRPRVLRDVSAVDPSVSLPAPLGRLPTPLLIAPMAMQALACRGAECAIAAAAAAAGVPYILSTFASTPVEQVAAAMKNAALLASPPPPPPVLLMQIYCLRNRAESVALAQRARRAGAKALVLTVDAPVFGKRAWTPHRDAVGGDYADVPQVRDMLLATHQRTHHHSATATANTSAGDDDGGGGGDGDGGSSSSSSFDALLDASLDESIIQELVRDSGGLPVWVKGVLRGDDADRAVRAGAAAIVVSNHGGRQADGAVAAVLALRDVAAAVAGRVPVLVDSGVRSGVDVVRALALGASAVLLGRPVLWAAAIADAEAAKRDKRDSGGGTTRGSSSGAGAGGSTTTNEGVAALLRDVTADVKRTMALVGARNVREVTADLVIVTQPAVAARL